MNQYKVLKKIVLTFMILLAILGIGWLAFTILFNSFYIYITPVVLMLFIYYGILYLLIKFFIKESSHKVLFVIVWMLLFVPFIWLYMDAEHIINFLADLLFPPLDMK